MQDILFLLTDSAKTLLQLMPYILIGVLLGEALKYANWGILFQKFCAGTNLLTVFLAAILGIISPLCTFGTVPIVLGLLHAGTPLAPLIAFLAASSMMNPQLFIMTAGALSVQFAILQTTSVLGFAVLVGYATWFIPTRNVLARSCNTVLPKCRKPRTWQDYLLHCRKTLSFISFYITIGVLLSSLIKLYIPVRTITMLLGPHQWQSVFIAALLGAPVYACSGGAIPLIKSLLQSGMSQGAALAFFLVGPATRITPLMALSTIIRPAAIGVYIGMVILYASCVGIFLLN